jgi:1-acyl-sn-glycerol-3-phosphate acyltransferase
MRWFWKASLKLMGWDTTMVFPYHHLKKFVMIVGPHTSSWDFIIGIAYRSLLGLQRTKFLGKKELFNPPFGGLLRAMGGIPVDRSERHSLVEQVVALFNVQHEFTLALSPEGTRKKVQKLKTGFYFIALKAMVPIIMVGFDYKNKTVVFSEPLMPHYQEEDFKIIEGFYGAIYGKIPENGMLVK